MPRDFSKVKSISIHALREEGDVGIAARIVEVQVISIHASVRRVTDRFY